METIALVGLITAAGYYLQDKTPRNQENIRNLNEKDNKITKMSELEKPNSLNIYNSDKVNVANDEVLKRSLQNYKDSEKPAFTGILPPIYNSYNSIGNDTILNVNVQQSSSAELAKIDDNTRRTNVFNFQTRKIQDRPMFNVSNIDGIDNQDEQIFSNFGSGLPSNQNLSLLTGKPIERDHSNMVPFFGSNVKQNIETFTNQTTLDHFTGNTSTFIHKQEVAPRFVPVKQDISGTPLLTDNIDTSRFIPSAYRQGEKPFYEEKISAPIAGTFYNPLSQNFQPSIDTLRVANKQQISYEGRTKAGQMGSVRAATVPVTKNRPDTHYTLGQDRLFTSTGAVIGNRAQDNYDNFASTSRQDQNIEYYGAKVAKESLVSGPRLKDIDNADELDFSAIFQTPKRTQLRSDTERNVGSQIPGVNDYGKESYNLPELERETSNEYHTLNVNKSSSGQRVALQDNARITIKETIVDKRDNSGNIRRFINKDNNTGVTDYSLKTTNKETLIRKDYRGNATKKDQVGYNIAKYNAKTTNKEITSDTPYSGNANASNKTSMIRSTFENPEKVRNAVHAENYRGAGKHHTSNAENRTQYNNAEITEKKEILLKGARPSGRKSTLGSISTGVDSVGETKLTPNMLLKERSKDRIENVNLQNVIPSKEVIGNQQPLYHRYAEVENNRINSNLVKNQLSKNPFYNLD
jgi:hypothetical protein